MNTITVNHLLEVFQKYRMAPTAIDEYESVGKEILREKISSFVSLNKEINFIMLGYPIKSTNTRDKTLGVLPDMAEEVSFENFKNFNNDIKEFYDPGVKIKIASDGYVFSDVLEVSDKIVLDYEEMVKDMARVAPIQFFDLTDFYDKSSSINVMREKIVSQFGITDVELERRILMDSDVNYLYRGMIRFMEEEIAMKNYPSRNQLNKAAKILTRQMMHRNEAYSGLVREEFKSDIRLSMHPSVNNGNKYSFQLIHSNRAWTSPWHCALLIDKGEFATVHRKDAEAAGYELIYKDNRPYYFINN